MAATTSSTPHTLRRTHISIALLANNFNVKWVMVRAAEEQMHGHGMVSEGHCGAAESAPERYGE